ncbi:SDR family NAD(P)-dependent oxidoreductase [Weissella soli]|uniref:NAD(P)-dependent dehydrogenase (Short-subunit alcohol dehydrogenase family) n=1 Tax=Weissella soli TaxID=155866 RepID=A0A288Q5T6_9LACO|nr:SDR family NAD(P)-dependent oxidoreductase [Weissella soli]AOT56069.1 putative oxidoreductase [Weissella soli]NKY82530.1 SDR family NAD(P)-dependent oxidoreductase [Weissella soli]RDL11643.1 NAD(P)-dependent dehydrogenase (short-subunit alcohol dehydrogenase family) [Weissella soli]GEN93130.1 carbonyl reductase [Weissella soli]
MKKALITGANKGIGFEIAKQLKAAGYEIFIGARNANRGQEAATVLGGQYVPVDLNDLHNLAEIQQAVGTLDLLVNNAGIPGDMHKSGLDFSDRELRETMEVNFFGTHQLIDGLRTNLAADGVIINVTIPVTPKAYFSPLAYQTSKAAQNVLTMNYGMAFAQSGSQRRIWGFMPGAVATDLNGLAAGGFVKTPAAAAALIVATLSDGQNHNGKLVNWDGSEIAAYEVDFNQLSVQG